LPVILSVGYIKNLLSRRNELLERAGFTVIAATSAVQALSAAREARPDLAIFGHGVPTEDRNSIAEALRAVHPAIHFIYLYRGHASYTEMADAILNVEGDPADLVETVRYLMEKKAAAEKARPTRGTAVRAIG
jgi:DNA-binding response OmpR family regulator